SSQWSSHHCVSSSGDSPGGRCSLAPGLAVIEPSLMRAHVPPSEWSDHPIRLLLVDDQQETSTARAAQYWEPVRRVYSHPQRDSGTFKQVFYLLRADAMPGQVLDIRIVPFDFIEVDRGHCIEAANGSLVEP